MSTDPMRRKVAFFGHFGRGNFGNESSLKAILYHLRRRVPDAELLCICSGPDGVAEDYNISAIPVTGIVVRSWVPRSPLARLVKGFLVGIPTELYRWFKGFILLRGTDALIVPGTGLLTDAYGLFGWGPYNLFKWSTIAKLCSCKLFFVSVGAGPIYSRAGRFFVKAALTLADFRSYRDESTQQLLRGIGFSAHNDRVSPDLSFSLPALVSLKDHARKPQRLIVGLGLIEYAGIYSADNPNAALYSEYLDVLAHFARWLLDHDYDVRLLIGDVGDMPVTREFKALLKTRSIMYEEGRIIDERVASVEDLLSQFAETDFVVATRFHNVLFSLLLNKPVIAISFHHKSSSLMSQMGLAEYCQDLNDLKVQRLIEQFRQLEQNAGRVKRIIRERVGDCRDALDEQYSVIFRDICPDRNALGVTSEESHIPVP